jgi:hypothetical protein
VKTLIDTCYTRKGTREYYRVTHLGMRDLPMGIIFCVEKHHRAIAQCVNIPVEQLVRLTPSTFNRAWKDFCLGIAAIPVAVNPATKPKLRRVGKLNRNFP